MDRYDSGITDEIRKMVIERLTTFNQGKIPNQGRYYIMLPTPQTAYYTLWFYNPEAIYHSFVCLSNLELTIIGSLNKAMRMTANSFLPLGVVREIDSAINNGDDILTFGKYRGFHLQEVYTIDPRYVLWIANKYEPRVKSEFRFKELACNYSKAYQDLQTQKRDKPSGCHFVGNVGDKLENIHLTITKVKIEDNAYRTKVVNGTCLFFVDQLITAIDKVGNRFLFSIKAKDRSLTSGVLPPSAHAYQKGEAVVITSAKILKHLVLHNTKYTKLGYIKSIYIISRDQRSN